MFMRIAEPSDSLAGELLALLRDLRVIADENRGVRVCFDLGGWSPALFADILGAGFDLLTYRKGPAPDVPVATFTTVACADDRGRHDYDLADTTVTMDITAGPRNGPGREPAAGNPPRPRPPRPQPPDSHPHLPDGSERRRGVLAHVVAWREENYFRCARTHFALDSYPQTPDGQKRMVPGAAKKTVAAGVRAAAQAVTAAQADRDAALLRAAQPPPAGHSVILTNQALNAPAKPPGASSPTPTPRRSPPRPASGSAIWPRIWSGWSPSRSPRPSGWPPAAPRPPWPAPSKATTPASATSLARSSANPSPSPATSTPHPGQLLILLDPLTAPRRAQALAALCRQLNTAQTATQAPSSSFATKSNPHPDPA